MLSNMHETDIKANYNNYNGSGASTLSESFFIDLCGNFFSFLLYKMYYAKIIWFDLERNFTGEESRKFNDK